MYSITVKINKRKLFCPVFKYIGKIDLEIEINKHIYCTEVLVLKDFHTPIILGNEFSINNNGIKISKNNMYVLMIIMKYRQKMV